MSDPKHMLDSELTEAIKEAHAEAFPPKLTYDLSNINRRFVAAINQEVEKDLEYLMNDLNRKVKIRSRRSSKPDLSDLKRRLGLDDEL